MTSRHRRLPLFPLNQVLFPGSSIPLQIFESRYKRMLRDCLDDDSRFGVVLIKRGPEVGEPSEPYSIGTVARIVQVSEIDGGRYFISATGIRRFRIDDVTQQRPYMAAEVELLDEGVPDEPEQASRVDLDAVRETFSAYARVMIGISGGWTRSTRVPSDPAALSFHIAEKLDLDLLEKQSLLEALSADERLELEMDILHRDTHTMSRRLRIEFLSRVGRQ
ncbi:MAG: LON peptidase substrate-binding domain-containing protein [SAR202 cluster bacterium]|jgi:Lon protease-like protein|nr:LON peptidase substrate-binding domain-containing protein [SAR202 cluster bacterium]MDP6302012.1 LON peptidase substrate-binding domain-containing protein [SAR202 cluster bacterium]MDP7105055.1 LON peptidase substrate-binding domain-containing protein [SAR202 cluster bacterium]MDP7226649.1 LON peptidase substrate-binding domain-containing protein [SAR202 cluster bacterium]MDP7412794.1 LON peptidase substrate-binding domain-containing protein [SAR202 cluster bacterium]|tara:strand:+ start:3326 stop:3985 length:660 start_codon:yes stop_codon:yes gene_type:complete